VSGCTVALPHLRHALAGIESIRRLQVERDEFEDRRRTAARTPSAASIGTASVALSCAGVRSAQASLGGAALAAGAAAAQTTAMMILIA
jgi:hypothetical protein